MPHFGRRLRALRTKTSKSQADLAVETGIQQTRISFLERQDNAPKEEVVQVFANHFSVPITYFYGNEPEQPNQNTINYIESLKNEPVDENQDIEVIMHSISELGNDQIATVKSIVESFYKKNSNR